MSIWPTDFAQPISLSATGIVATNNACLGIDTIGVVINGTWTGTAAFEASLDNANWVAITGVPYNGGAGVSSVTANGTWFFSFGGYRYFRVNWTRSSGTITGTIAGSVAPGELGPSGSAALVSETSHTLAARVASATAITGTAWTKFTPSGSIRRGVVITNPDASLGLWVRPVTAGAAAPGAPTGIATDATIRIPANSTFFLYYDNTIDLYFCNSSGLGTTSGYVAEEFGY